MVKKLTVCEQIIEYGCLVEPQGEKDSWGIEKPPSQLYAVFLASNDPYDCPQIPISPIIIEYKDPKQTVWTEFLRWTPDIIYEGYIYMYWTVAADQLLWGDWRVRYGEHVHEWHYKNTCETTFHIMLGDQDFQGVTVTLEDAQQFPQEVRMTDAQGIARFTSTIDGVRYNVVADAGDLGTKRFGFSKSCVSYLLTFTPPAEPPPDDTSWYDYKLTLNLKPWRTSPTDPTTEALTVLLGLANPFPFPFNFKNVVYLTNPDRLEIDYELQHNPVPILGIVAICSAIAIAIIAAGWIITSWNNTKIETQEQTQELYEYIPTFADELTTLGFTPDEILQIMSTIGTTKPDWTKYILPVVGIAALAYFLASKPWK